MAAIAPPMYLPEAQVELVPLPIYEQLIEKTIGGHTFLLQSDEGNRNYVVVINDQAYPMTWDQILKYSASNRVFPAKAGYDFGGKFFSKGKKFHALEERLAADSARLDELLNSEAKTIVEQVEVTDWQTVLSAVVKTAVAVYLLAFISFLIFSL